MRRGSWLSSQGLSKNTRDRKNRSRRGFTLLELLIVIAILAILSAVTVFAINPVRQFQKARDNTRLEDMDKIEQAIQMYILNTGDGDLQSTSEYGEGEGGAVPPSAQGACQDVGSWDTSACDWDGDEKYFMEFLYGSLFPGDPPKDPSNDLTRRYRFYRYSAGSYGCDPGKGSFYVLGIDDLETQPRPPTNQPFLSPGWACPSRNWQNEFDWVTGKFLYR